MSSFSTGVTRTKRPSGSRRRMVENSRTIAGRPIGLPSMKPGAVAGDPHLAVAAMRRDSISRPAAASSPRPAARSRRATGRRGRRGGRHRHDSGESRRDGMARRASLAAFQACPILSRRHGQRVRRPADGDRHRRREADRRRFVPRAGRGRLASAHPLPPLAPRRRGAGRGSSAMPRSSPPISPRPTRRPDRRRPWTGCRRPGCWSTMPRASPMTAPTISPSRAGTRISRSICARRPCCRRPSPPGPSGGGLIVNLLDAKLAQPNPDFFSYTDLQVRARRPHRAAAPAPGPGAGIRVCGIAPSVTLVSGPQSRDEFRRGPRAQRARPRGARSRRSSPRLRFIIATPTLTGQTITLDGGQRFLGLARDVQFLEPDDE